MIFNKIHFIATLSTFLLVTLTANAQTTFTVTNTSDTGGGSFRQAIVDANTTAGTDTIDFDITGAGPHTIIPNSALPEIDEAVVIRGYTQPGASVANSNSPATLMLELDGANAGDDTHGLVLNAPGCIVRGLTINNFGRSGILVNTDNCTVQGNYIGTDPSGTQAAGNGFRSTDGFVYDGIWINDTANNQIGGTTPEARNLLSANAEAGVYIGGSNATGNKVQGNFIGTDSSGTQALGNDFDGVILDLETTNNLIGGTVSGAGNLISGNLESGIFITDSGGGSNTIQGNYIGTDVTGTQPLGNHGAGVGIINSSNNLIGGSEPGAGNIMSANGRPTNGTASGQAGLGIVDGGGNNTIQGNWIGTDITGTQALGNGDAGILLRNTTNNLIGGTVTGAGNLVSDNFSSGIAIEDQADGNQVRGNLIGVDINGTNALGNGAHGVVIAESSNNTVGGTMAGARNVISANEFAGVRISQETGSASGNAVQGNYIGTNISGSQALGNGEDGVSIRQASNNLIGGTSDAARNVLSGHGFAGVFLNGEEATNNRIEGNFIGSNAAATDILPNADSGVDIFLASDNVIGGTEDGAGNLIAGNQLSGVTVRLNNTALTVNSKIFSRRTDKTNWFSRELHGRSIKVRTLTSVNAQSDRLLPGSLNKQANVSAPGNGNAVRRNSMFQNAVLGIDLASVPRGNDAGDSDDGENRGQNYPELEMATGNGVNLSVTYSISSSPNLSGYPISVEFFLASADGQGKVFLGGDVYTDTDVGNNKVAVITPDTTLADGDEIVATATDSAGNTSEFSEPFAITGVVSVDDSAEEIPQTFVLEQNYPNPFNPSTTIRYSLSSQSQVELRIFDALGRLITTLVQENQTAGSYSVTWDGRTNSGENVASGHYFYEIKVGDFVSRKQMILVK